MDKLAQLKDRLTEVSNLRNTGALLGWDRQVMMPPGGATIRAAQQATLAKISHQTFTAAETGDLIAAAEAEAAGLPADSDDACLVARARRDYDLATKEPTALVTEIARVTSLAHHAWEEARAENDFAAFLPWLEQIVDLTIQRAEALGYEDHVYDALLDRFEPGMKTAEVRALFDELKAGQIPLVAAISERLAAVDADVLRRDYDRAIQEAVSREVATLIGYDFQRGRLDPSTHPFTSGTGTDDTRITTRYQRDWLPAALFATLHECGHGMYGQGCGRALVGTFLEGGASLGVHESQSRLWENIVGRGREFWRYYYPRLQKHFSGVLDDVDEETFYRAINRVQPSFIRVEADEVTYNLHIIIRFELEQALVSGDLKPKDAADAWNAKYQEYLGITPPTDSVGVLQDVHWSNGYIGYFSTYALGNLLSVQFYERALADHPDLPQQFARGEFGALLAWMQTHIHAHGRKFMPKELTARVAGGPIQTGPYLGYLREKFGAIYNL